MPNTKIIHSNYTMKIQKEQLVLPLNLGLIIPEDDSVRLLSQIAEGLDYTKLMQAYSHKGRKPKIHPPTLFTILVYAYSQGIYSSRKIEKACRRDIHFRWLLEGESIPDHNTINRFRGKRLSLALEDLFYQFIKQLHEIDEIQYENLFVDGTKIEANANKYTFVWKKSVSKHEQKLQDKIKKFLESLDKEYAIETTYDHQQILIILKDIYNRLLKIKEEKNIVFVSGKGKRKTQLQRDLEELKVLLDRQEKYEGYHKLFDGRNSFSKTDTGATFMHMKEDHMRNSQLKPGYNVQIGVENEYIVSMDISSERSDQLTLIPFLDKMEDHLDVRYKNIVADAGYESEENYVYLEKNEQISYIKPASYEKQKKRNFKRQIGKRENMDYDKDKDFYICHNNKKLMHIANTTRRSKSGYKTNIKIYECESCEGCIYKDKCTKAKGNRKLYVSETFIKKREDCYKNITSEKGIILRMNRSIQVEGAFGVLKQDYGFRRFLTRGKKNVGIEFMLLSFGFNINKLHSRIIDKRIGNKLYKAKKDAS